MSLVIIAYCLLLRTLDALHVATYVSAREKIDDLELVTVDERPRSALTEV